MEDTSFAPPIETARGREKKLAMSPCDPLPLTDWQHCTGHGGQYDIKYSLLDSIL